MSSTPNSLPSFGTTFSPTQITTVARDLSLPFRRDVNTPWQAFSAPPTFRNPQNTRNEAIFFYSNEPYVCFSDIDIENQSFSSVDETPLRRIYGQKIAGAILRLLLAIKSFGRTIIRRH